MNAARTVPTLIAAAMLLAAAATAPSLGVSDAAPRDKGRKTVVERHPVKDQDSVAPAPVADDSPIKPALAPAAGAEAKDAGAKNAKNAKRRVSPAKKSTD
jgi:hypothetical protein